MKSSPEPAQPAQPTEPSTPKSLKRDITKTEEDESPTSVEGTPTPSPKKKLQRTKAATKPKPSPSPSKRARRTIPKSASELTEEDKMILDWRKEGKTFAEIAAQWTEMTGENVRSDVIRKRHDNIRANIQEFPQEDAVRLLRVKSEVEEKLRSEKWSRIADGIVAEGGGRYPALALQKKYMELSKKSGLAQEVN